MVRGRKGPGYLGPGTKVTGNERSTEGRVCRFIRSQEQKFPGTIGPGNVPGNERSRKRMFQGMNSPENESSIMGTNVPGNK